MMPSFQHGKYTEITEIQAIKVGRSKNNYKEYKWSHPLVQCRNFPSAFSDISSSQVKAIKDNSNKETYLSIKTQLQGACRYNLALQI